MRRVKKNERVRVAVMLNGRKVAAEAEPRMLLSDFIRHAPPVPMSAASTASAAPARC
jgi:aerobic-type carbon monoxide dehydrogenase small subunit (CoxS/CutS family)